MVYFIRAKASISHEYVALLYLFPIRHVAMQSIGPEKLTFSHFPAPSAYPVLQTSCFKRLPLSVPIPGPCAAHPPTTSAA